MKIASAVGYTLCRVPVDSVVRKSMMFSNVIVDITISRRSFVFSQSCLEVPASLSDVGDIAHKYSRKVIAKFKKRGKQMIGHHTHLRENDDLCVPLWQVLAIKKKLPFFKSAHAKNI